MANSSFFTKSALGCCAVGIIFLVMALVAGKAVQNKKDDPTCSCSDVKSTRNICIVVTVLTFVCAVGCLVKARKVSSTSGTPKAEAAAIELPNTSGNASSEIASSKIASGEAVL